MDIALREGDLDVLLLKLSLNGLVDIKEYSPVIRCLGPDTEVEVQAAFAEGRQARGGSDYSHRGAVHRVRCTRTHVAPYKKHSDATSCVQMATC